MVKCGICHYVSPPDGPKHDARTCPLKYVQCRKNLPMGHAFYSPGQCVKPLCIHNAHCNNCGFQGHVIGTLKLSPTRFKFNDKGILVRKQNRTPLGRDDFVCTVIRQDSIENMINNTQIVSAAKDVDAHERRVSTCRLQDNINSGGLDLNETIRLIEHKGTNPALLSPKNKENFLDLTKNAHLGAIEASRIAPEQAESGLEDESDGQGDISAEDAADEKSPSNGGDGKKTGAVRRLEKTRRNRTDRYAVALFRGRQAGKAGMRPGQSKPRSPRPSKSGSGSGCASMADPKPRVTDVDDAIRSPGHVSLPAGSRMAFDGNLPAFYSPTFAATPPVALAHTVWEHMCHCPVADVDKELGAIVVKGSVDFHVRGYMLSSGTLSAAQVAEWLCSAMAVTMQTATVSSIARAVSGVVEAAATAAATATGLKTPVERL